MLQVDTIVHRKICVAGQRAEKGISAQNIRGISVKVFVYAYSSKQYFSVRKVRIIRWGRKGSRSVAPLEIGTGGYKEAGWKGSIDVDVTGSFLLSVWWTVVARKAVW